MARLKNSITKVYKWKLIKNTVLDGRRIITIELFKSIKELNKRYSELKLTNNTATKLITNSYKITPKRFKGIKLIKIYKEMRVDNYEHKLLNELDLKEISFL